MHQFAKLGWLVVLLTCGCVDDETSLPIVGRNPFTARPTSAQQKPILLEASPATTDAQVRAALIGQKLQAANNLNGVGMRPAIRAIGAPQPAIFHRGSAELFVTEGLVRECETDEQLAAVIALELGKMVSEREALASPAARVQKRLPPINLPVGNDQGGAFGPADGIRLAELAEHEREAKAQRARVSLPPDPTSLAQQYLRAANHDPNALVDVAPILKRASHNVRLERQLKSTIPAANWKPAGAGSPE